jgi:hypothetical protein
VLLAVSDWLFGDTRALVSGWSVEIFAAFTEIRSLKGTVGDGSVADSVGEDVV